MGKHGSMLKLKVILIGFQYQDPCRGFIFSVWTDCIMSSVSSSSDSSDPSSSAISFNIDPCFPISVTKLFCLSLTSDLAESLARSERKEGAAILKWLLNPLLSLASTDGSLILVWLLPRRRLRESIQRRRCIAARGKLPM